MEALKAICVSMILLALSGSGCARLPDVSKVAGQAPVEAPPKILSARGMVSPAKASEMMARLQGAVYRTDMLQRHNAVLEMITGKPLTQGNKVSLLIDGHNTYAAIFKAIENATDSINMETYEIDDDAVGRRIADLLVKKQRAGVQVNLIYDAIGCIATPAAFFDRLRQAGVQVLRVNSFKAHADFITHADHRKLLVVDGKLVITGGINITQVYTSAPFRSDGHKPPVPWRDTDVEIEGPAAADFQKLFVAMWQKQKGPPLPQARYFPKLESHGGALVRAIGSTPGESNRDTYVSYVCALLFAEHSIHLTNAYFIPDDRTLDALTRAARNGVDVKIIVPSITDSALAKNAMRHTYSELLKAGVKIYERKKALLHAKTAVIDGVWSTVGSTNFDFLSLSTNYEINAVILSPEFAARMEEAFNNDLAESTEITWQKWHQRPFSEKAKEFLAHMLSHVL